MARGRMLNNKISASLQFHDLPDDTCRLLATWTISHLDMNGVFYGDPVVVKSYVFPRRASVSVEQIASYLEAMTQAVDGDGNPLIILFQARGDTWQWWPAFSQNQPGLRADRESSSFPQPPAEIPPDSRAIPAQFPRDDGTTPGEVKRSKAKSSQVKSSKVKEPPAATAAATPTSQKDKDDNGPSPPSKHQSMFTALAAAYRIDARKGVITDKQRGRLNSMSKRLRQGDYTPAEVTSANAHWWQEDWRGKKGGAPTDSQFLETLTKLRTEAHGPTVTEAAW